MARTDAPEALADDLQPVEIRHAGTLLGDEIPREQRDRVGVA
jgi:hypothetical protein